MERIIYEYVVLQATPRTDEVVVIVCYCILGWQIHNGT